MPAPPKLVTVCVLSDLLWEKRLKLKELAQRADLNEAGLSRIKTGKTTRIDLETINKLCDVLGCGPGDLLKRMSPKDAAAYFKRPFPDLAVGAAA